MGLDKKLETYNELYLKKFSYFENNENIYGKTCMI
jgi:hypothetical protein